MTTTDQGCAGRKPAFDKYATAKSGGNLLLSGGLLADNLTELNNLIKIGPEAEPQYVPMLVILVSGLLLNVTCIILSLVLGTMTYPSNNTYEANMVVPSDFPVTRNGGMSGDGGMSMRMEKAKEVPSPRTPSKLRVLNNAMTVLTGLTFVLATAKNSIRSGNYVNHLCGEALKNRTS